MERVIWKYKINTIPGQIVVMPKGAVVLKVDLQEGVSPVIWAIVDKDEQDEEKIYIETFPTGEIIDDHEVSIKQPRRYLGTYGLMGGALVYHVFVSKLKEE